MSLQTNNNIMLSAIETMVKEHNISYIEAIIEYCNINNLEIEYGADVVKKDPLLKNKIEIEAQNLLMLKNSKQMKPTNKLTFIDDEDEE